MQIIQEKEYNEKMQMVEEKLSEIHSMELLEVKGGMLSVNLYHPSQMSALMVLLHGTTESVEKYHELIWYLISCGIGIVAPDMRGHGKSLRQVEDPYLVHVDRFEDYVDDAEKIVDRFTGNFNGPLYLLGHSLGGAVAAALMLRMPDRFTHVILSSPMVDPATSPYPRWMGQMIANAACLTGLGKKMAFVSSPYDAEKNTFESACDTGKVRFEYYKSKREKNKDYQTNGLSYRWIAESFRVKKMLLEHPNLKMLRSKVLLCQADLDTVVYLPPQDAFVSVLPDARLVRFDEAKHEIYMSEDRMMECFVDEILRFLGVSESV